MSGGDVDAVGQGVGRREWWFPVALAVLIFVVGSAPYVYGYLTAPEGQVFMGFVGRGTPGANGYFAFAKQVQEGFHLIENKMTPEPTRRDYFNLEWWVFGQMARQFGLSLEAVFHITRAMIVLFYVCAVYWLISLCLGSLFSRRLALLIICFGSGLGWLIWLGNHYAHLDLLPSRDIRGVSIFGYLVNKPHFILGAALATMTQAYHLLAYRRGKTRYFVYSGVAAALHSLVRPYGIPETHALWLAYPALLCIRDGQFSFARFKGAAIAIAVHGPVFAYFIYYAITGSLGNPDWSRLPGHVVENFLWMGIPMVAFFLGLPWHLRMRGNSDASLLLTAWFVLAWLHCGCYPYIRGGQEAAYYSFSIVPTILTLGVTLPMFWGYLQRVWPWVVARLPDFSLRDVRVAGSAVLLAACLPSSAIVYGEYFTTLRQGTADWTFCISRDLYDALVWLDGASGEQDVAIASLPASQFVSRLGRSKTVTGHDFLTAKYLEKNDLVQRFYSRPEDAVFKTDLLCKYRVQWVVYSEFEQRMGKVDFDAFPWLSAVYRKGNVAIYKVDLEAASQVR